MGMDEELRHIAKGVVNRRVDSLLNDLKNPDRNEFIEALNDWTQDFLTVLQIAGVTDQEIKHLREYWYDPNWADANSECWWRQHQPIQPIIRQGLIQAIEVTMRDPDTGERRAQPLPIDSYWIYGDQDQCEVIVTWTDHQVTRLILTPRPPEYVRIAPGALTGKAPIQIVKRQVVEHDHPPPKRHDEAPEGIVEDVKILEYVKAVEGPYGVMPAGTKVVEYMRLVEDEPGVKPIPDGRGQKIIPEVKASRVHVVTTRLKAVAMDPGG